MLGSAGDTVFRERQAVGKGNTKKRITIMAIIWTLLLLSMFMLVLLFARPVNIQAHDLPGLFLFIFLPYIVIFTVCRIESSLFQARIQRQFWKTFAAERGWTYAQEGSIPSEYGILLVRNVQSRHKQKSFLEFMTPAVRGIKNNTEIPVLNNIEGVVSGRSIRIFEYSFQGAASYRVSAYWLFPKILRKRTIANSLFYTVFVFHFQKTLPHMFLDAHGTPHAIRVGKKVGLPSEFSKRFSLFAPPGYKREALEVFTPDFLAFLLDLKLPHDVEFLDNRLIVYVHGRVQDREQLKREYQAVSAMIEHLGPRLDRFCFELIGDKRPILV